MGFLAPAFLIGLLGIGLPLWLHLLRRHRSQPQPFGSLMFFERRTQSSIEHRRLKHLLLLALRLALLVLLALAFAQPYIQRAAGPGIGVKKMLVVVVDQSFSMREGDRMERAQREARAAVASLGAGNQGQVLGLDSQVHLLTPATDDRAQLDAAIASIKPTDSRSSYGELARALRSVAQSSRVPVEAHLVSDMQKSSLPPGFADLRLGPDTRLIAHAVADRRRPNWVVEAVNAPRHIADPKKVRVQATIASYGGEAAERTASLVVNGRVIASKSVKIPAGGRATVEFLALDAAYGWNRCEVRIEPGDSLKEDDRFYFAAERADPRRVLFVHEARQPRGVLYFRAALDASAEALFTLEAVTPEQTANLQPQKYGFVVLSDVVSIPPAFEAELKKFVEAGGSVLISAGASTAVRGKIPLLDLPVIESRYAARSGERFLTAATVDAVHPSLRKANRWEGVKFYQAIRVEPGSALKVVARLSDETPLLLERMLGAGRVLLFASTFDNIANDFPLHASFVPFVEQTARYMAGIEERASTAPVDSFLELRAGREEGGARRAAAVDVIDPAGGRALSLKESSTAETLRLDRAGFYEVRRENGRQDVAAVNSDRRESDLDLVPPETLTLWQNTGEPAPQGVAGEAPPSRPWSLWWYVALILLMVALAESVLARRYLGEESGL